MKSLLVEKILQTRKITDYLASKGHVPVGGEVNGKFRYRCPIHSGDRTPSFMVYLTGEFENYYCFGCKARYHIIHLYRDMENVSLRKAIEVLGAGLDVDVESELSYAIDQIINDKNILKEFTPPQLALGVAQNIRLFLDRNSYDKELVSKCDEIGKMVDDAIDQGNMKALNLIAENLHLTFRKINAQRNGYEDHFQ